MSGIEVTGIEPVGTNTKSKGGLVQTKCGRPQVVAEGCDPPGDLFSFFSELEGDGWPGSGHAPPALGVSDEVASAAFQEMDFDATNLTCDDTELGGIDCGIDLGGKGYLPLFHASPPGGKPAVLSWAMVGGEVFYRPCGLSCAGRHSLAGVPLQLNPCKIFDECFGHPRGQDTRGSYIFDGVVNGFRIVDTSYDGSYFRTNYDSVKVPGVKAKLDELYRDELVHGKVIKVEDQPQCVHALGAISKPDGGVRPITDCKRGPVSDVYNSINAHMLDTCQKFSYISIDHVTDTMTRGMHFGVVDIRAAYRSIAIHPDDRGKQGFVWDLDGVEDYYHDCAMAFGTRCSPFIFTQITEFVIRCLERRGITGVFGYLDDYLVTGDTYEDTVWKQGELIGLLRDLGFHIQWKKLVTPATKAIYLGMLLDSVDMTVSLPQEKVARLKTLVEGVRDKKVITRKDLEVLCGHLAHASQVVRGGRTFSRRVINLLKFLPDKVKSVRIPDWFRDDVVWWCRFCDVFNGGAKVINHLELPNTVVETDSSLTGFGASAGDDWLLGVWDPTSEKVDMNIPIRPPIPAHHMVEPPDEYDSEDTINLLELWPVIAAAHRWGQSWSGCKVVVMTDNTQVQRCVNTGRSKGIKTMWWLRELFWLSVIFNFHIVARRIKGSDNVLPDYLSRYFDPKFVGVIPSALVMSLCCFRRGLAKEAVAVPT